MKSWGTRPEARRGNSWVEHMFFLAKLGQVRTKNYDLLKTLAANDKYKDEFHLLEEEKLAKGSSFEPLVKHW